jgi:ribosome maturation factor RimP
MNKDEVKKLKELIKYPCECLGCELEHKEVFPELDKFLRSLTIKYYEKNKK